MAKPTVRVQDYALPELDWNERTLQRWVQHQAACLGWSEKASDRRQLVEDAAALGVDVKPDPLIGLVFHDTVAFRSEAGWPDLWMFRRHDRRIVVAELKSERGKLTPRQVEVLELLRVFECPYLGSHTVTGGRETTIQVFEWRPSDGARILEVLA